MSSSTQNLILKFVYICVLLVSGCADHTDKHPLTPTVIHDFALESSQSTAQKFIVNAAATNTQFTLSWDVTSSDPYYVQFYISDDTVIDQDDIRIYTNQCGEFVSTTDKCQTTGEVTCTLSSTNKLVCGTISSTNKEKLLGEYLAQSPKEAFIVLQACNGSTQDCKTQFISVEFITTQSSINSFLLSSTHTPTAGKIPIDNNSGGEFSISWDAVSSDPYTVYLFLSEDEALSGDPVADNTNTGAGDIPPSDPDIIFFSQTCGSDPQMYECGTAAAYTCRLTTSNYISCGTIGSGNTPIEITAFLDTKPKDAFIILQVCNFGSYSCQSSSVPVVFQ